MIIITQTEYRDRLHGGWLGKLAGVAAGLRTEGERQPEQSTEETLLPPGAVTCEGLDFQAVWLRALQGAGPRITDDDFIGAWFRHTTHAGNELAHARANFRRGLNPPLSGVFDNPYREDSSAMARADLWGMLAPGDPEQAAWFARRDAMLDHAGAGVEAAIWLAALVSAVFVEKNAARLVELPLSLLPPEGRVGKVVRDVLRWHGEHASWTRTRELLLRIHGNDNTRDAVVSVGVTTLALLHARGDLVRGVVTAANCGLSATCTSGAVGAILGVLLGEAGLPGEWRTEGKAEVLLSAEVAGLPTRLTAGALANQTRDMGRIVIRSESGGRVELTEEEPEGEQKLPAPDGGNLLRQLAVGPYVTTHRRGPIRIQVDYGGAPSIGYNRPCRLAIALTNTANRTLEVTSRLAAPLGFVVAASSEPITLTEGTTVTFLVTITAPREGAPIALSNPCTLFLALDDGANYTVPLTLAGEALWWVAGPFDGFEGSYHPEQPQLLSGELPFAGTDWRGLSVVEPAVDVLAAFSGEQGAYYFASDIKAAESMSGRMRVACNDGVVIWLNGEQVFAKHEHRAMSPASADEIEINLQEGWNRLVIKLAQCTPRRMLAVSLMDAAGHLLLNASNTEPKSS